jgi:hypothetical protein
MAANSLVEPLAAAPDRPSIEVFARFGTGDKMAALLNRSGASYAEAGEAARLIASAVPGGVAPGTSVAIKLGRRSPSGVRPIERIAFRAGIDLNVALTAGANGIQLSTSRIAVDNSASIRGRVGDGLYWALRASGVAPGGRRISSRWRRRSMLVRKSVGRPVRPDRRQSPRGHWRKPEARCSMRRSTGRAPAIRLMKWTLAGRTDWIAPMAPVSKSLRWLGRSLRR